jgi:hypothetical protein
MREYLRAGIVLAAFAIWPVAVSEAQEGLTKRDQQGPVTVAVTLVAPPSAGTPVRVRVVLDTHSVGLDGIAFDQAVAVRAADGRDVAPTAIEEASGSGHHRQAVLVFPAQAGPLRVVVKNVGGVAERSFVWDLPAGR